ncbi:MAG: hypothetical protein AABY22_14545 [Nanoarchaeota archaeon]
MYSILCLVCKKNKIYAHVWYSEKDGISYHRINKSQCDFNKNSLEHSYSSYFNDKGQWIIQTPKLAEQILCEICLVNLIIQNEFKVKFHD